MLIGYTRISTEDQHLDLQRDALTRADCEHTFENQRSGAKADRPGLLAVLDYARRGGQRRGVATAEDKRLYAQRNGVEGTLSQAVRAFGLRRARYRGLSKMGLQHIATAAALNLDRIAAWVAKRPLAPTRTSRFVALAA